MTPCRHPLAQLEVGTGNATARGQATIFNVKCRACLVTLAGAQGLHALVVALATDTDALWAAVFAIGGRRPQPVPATAQVQAGPAAPCAHFLSWLKLELCEARRGAEASATFRCSGCCEGNQTETRYCSG